MSEPPVSDAEDLVERAIESVLDQVPEVADEEPEGSAKLQPWADTAAPPSKNKRPLSELLEQYAARVAADPDAVAGRPRGQHPIAAFFARFTPAAGRGGDAAPGGARGRRRRGKRGAAGAVVQPVAAAPQGGGRSRRGGRPQGGRPQGEPRRQAPAAPPQPASPNAQGGEQRRSRRRGRRRGRGGGAPGGPSPAGG